MSDNPASILYDPSGIPLTGVAGSPATPVLTVQGVEGGNPQPVELATGGTLYDGRQIRALTNADVVTSQQGGTWTVSIGNFPGVFPVSGSLTASQGTAAGVTAPWVVRLSDGVAYVTPALSTQFPAALVAGRLDVNAGTWLGSTAPTVGAKTSGNSIPVVIASDQSAIAVSTPSVGAVGATPPSSAILVGGSDGTLLQSVRVHDLDTGAGAEYGLGVSLRLPASGGSVAGGTSTAPLRVDPTGTTTQPVQLSGYTSNTANQVITGISQTLGLSIQPGSSVATILIKGTFSSSSLLTFTGSPDGGVTFFPIQAQMLGSPGIMATSISGGAAPYCFRVHVAGISYIRVTCTSYIGGDAIDVTLTSVATTASFVEPIPSSSNTIGRVDLNSAIPAGSNTVGKVDQGAAGATPWPVRVQSSTSQYFQVNSVITVATILASNSSRIGATIYNNSTANLFLRLGPSASPVSFTVRMTPDAYYEVPFGYTGVITGTWATANGAALVTELT